jgi:Ser/Thr protein kinase RdoA (MazF antagonist)
LLHPLAEAWVVRTIDQEDAASMEVTQKPVAVKVNVSGADGSHIKEVVFGWSGARPITLLSFDSGALGIRHARQAQAAPGGERKISDL